MTKTNISLGCLDPSTLRPIFLEIAWQNWPLKIALSLLDFKQLLVDSGSIVHCIYLFLSDSALVRKRRGVEVPTIHHLHLPQSGSDFGFDNGHCWEFQDLRLPEPCYQCNDCQQQDRANVGKQVAHIGGFCECWGEVNSHRNPRFIVSSVSSCFLNLS